VEVRYELNFIGDMVKKMCCVKKCVFIYVMAFYKNCRDFFCTYTLQRSLRNKQKNEHSKLPYSPGYLSQPTPDVPVHGTNHLCHHLKYRHILRKKTAR
jgi:hypothetical protein